MTRLDWYIRRARVMTPREFADRAWRRLLLTGANLRTDWTAPTARVARAAPLAAPTVDCDVETRRRVVAEAEEYLAGRYEWLGVQSEEDPIDWHQDPATEHVARGGFGPTLDYRDIAVTTSAKNLWEKSRHRHTTLLAQAYCLTGEDRYAEAAVGNVLAWIDANPFPRGIHWASALEVGMRMIAWTWSARFLEGSSALDRLLSPQSRFWPSVYWHQWFLSRNRSGASSANNHLVGELVGLLCAAVSWPYWTESAEWAEESWSGLVREIELQTHASGINREQAFGYYLFACELFLLGGLAAEVAGFVIPAIYRARMQDAIESIDALADTAGGLPRYGDSDDGVALQLGTRNETPGQWLRQGAAAWLGIPATPPAQGNAKLGPRLLGLKPVVRHSAPPTGSIAWPDAGLYLLRANGRTAREIWCLIDGGPLGYLALAAHGHADALSFALRIGGQPFLVDPGTFAYHSDLPARAWFRGTAAHNTLLIDGVDQSEQAGPFLWASRASTSVTEWSPTSEGGRLVASHDGYTRLPGHPVHRRAFLLSGNELHIIDEVWGTGDHEVVLHFHVHPDVDLSLDRRTALLCGRSATITVALPEDLTWSVEAAWYSPRFNRRQESRVLRGGGRGSLPLRCETIMEIQHAH